MKTSRLVIVCLLSLFLGSCAGYVPTLDGPPEEFRLSEESNFEESADHGDESFDLLPDSSPWFDSKKKDDELASVNGELIQRPTTYESRATEVVYDDMYDNRSAKENFKELGNVLGGKTKKNDWIYLYSYQRCPIRPLPNDKTQVKASVRRGISVKVLPYNRHWVRVKEGYINERCFRPKDKKKNRWKTVRLQRNCRIRVSPSTKTATLEVKRKKTRIRVKKYRDGWYRSRNGYVNEICFRRGT